MTWSYRFYDPIPLPDGKTLETLDDCRRYIVALPRATQDKPEWIQAGTYVYRAATEQVAWEWFARSSIMRALYGKPRIGPDFSKPSGKPQRWGKRKLKRDE